MCHAREDVRIAVLAQEHRQVTIPTQVQWCQNVFVPKDIDSRPANTQRRID
jgi:hypothetical protein